MNPARPNAPNAPNAPEGAPNCWQCRHFAVSWDPHLPYLCKLMGFKSRIAPALEVLRADGQRCRGFMQKSGVANPGVAKPGTAGSRAA